MAVKLYVFDDDRARGWEPFALTRPIGELLFGCLLLRERSERVWGTDCAGHLAHPALVGFDESGAPGVVELHPLDQSETRILVNSRAVLDGGGLPPQDAGATLMVDGHVAGWVVPAGTPSPPDSVLRTGGEVFHGLPEVEVAGSWLGAPWDLVAGNEERIRRDADWLDLHAMEPHGGIILLGQGGLYAERGSRLEPGVIIDTRSGPVILDAGARVQGPARLTGPVFVGRDSVVLGGAVSGTSVGVRCKVRGEVASSVITGFSNKAHDGHLGHALLGRWVNLGAGTTNSDLKNNYGSVRVERGGGSIDTGLMKVGSFLGDHVRTGIGTLLNTGAVIGAGSNVFGGDMPPKFVPPFAWGSGADLSEYRFERFLDTARTVMGRRDQELSDAMAGVLERAFGRSREQRISRRVLP